MMKLATPLLFLLIGSCMSEENNSSNDPGIITHLLKSEFPEVQRIIMMACEKNNPDISGVLKSEEKDAISCFHSNDTTEEDTTGQLTKCYGGLVNKTTSCLNEKYLPQLLLDFAKAIPWDGYDIVHHEGLKKCKIILQKPDVMKSVLDCLATNDEGGIPPTKTKFCENLKLAARCLAGVTESNCEDKLARSVTSRLKSQIIDVCG
ncbi:hypothetical protein JTB14_011316 [Gonioctena quinquepunctata]|nr:hypothetical protein JTB14_011316 [Gonioctena quinquepunctata]